jgi:iron(III) transport system substrate-binding protein
MFPDGAPVSNWWDIVEKDENGNNKFNIVCANVGGDDTYITFYANMILNGDRLAEGYLQKYGQPIEYTYDASVLPDIPAENAGYELLYRLSQSKMTFIDDGDDIVDAVQGSSVPTLGLASAGKITNRDDNGWPVAWVTELAPFPNMMNTNYLYVVTGTDNPAGARLFIRYLMGGTDGQGQGFKPFTKEGNWSIRDDYNNTNNPFPIAESGAIAGDMEHVHDIFLDVKDFWDYWLAESPFTAG